LIQFIATILKFGEQGEKTGWTYIPISHRLANSLKENNKKSFRVKGKLDNYTIKGIALLPMGNGDFIMPLNATTRKGIKKAKGAIVNVCIEVDHSPILPSAELMECLQDEPTALANFNKFPTSYQNYYTKWIDSAKTDFTKAKRIAQIVKALSMNLNFVEMMRSIKEDKNKMY
jgi:hypothetical protein